MEFLLSDADAANSAVDGFPVREDIANARSHYRTRLIQAQLQDTAIDALGEVDIDNFDTLLEKNVSSNETALMEMDEFITQIQNWNSTNEQESLDDSSDRDAYTLDSAASLAAMHFYIEKLQNLRLNAFTAIDNGPESEQSEQSDFIENTCSVETPSQIDSLLRLLEERRVFLMQRQRLDDSQLSTAVDANKEHQEYSQQLLQSKDIDSSLQYKQELEFRKMLSRLQQQYVMKTPNFSIGQFLIKDDDDSDCDDGYDDGCDVGKNLNHIIGDQLNEIKDGNYNSRCSGNINPINNNDMISRGNNYEDERYSNSTTGSRPNSSNTSGVTSKMSSRSSSRRGVELLHSAGVESTAAARPVSRSKGSRSLQLKADSKFYEEDRFRQIEIEVKEAQSADISEKEAFVIASGVELQGGVADLEHSLRNFTDDLDRLLRD